MLTGFFSALHLSQQSFEHNLFFKDFLSILFPYILYYTYKLYIETLIVYNVELQKKDKSYCVI